IHRARKEYLGRQKRIRFFTNRLCLIVIKLSSKGLMFGGPSQSNVVRGKAIMIGCWKLQVKIQLSLELLATWYPVAHLFVRVSIAYLQVRYFEAFVMAIYGIAIYYRTYLSRGLLKI